MTIEMTFDIPFIAARPFSAEKHIQQNYLQIIAVQKWFAYRPSTQFRCLRITHDR